MLKKIILLLILVVSFTMINTTNAYNNPYSSEVSPEVQNKIVDIMGKIKGKKEQLSLVQYENYIKGLSNKLVKIKNIYKTKAGISEESRKKVISIISYLELEFKNLVTDDNDIASFFCEFIGDCEEPKSVIIVDPAKTGLTTNAYEDKKQPSICAAGYGGVGCNIKDGKFTTSHFANNSKNQLTTNAYEDTKKCKNGNIGPLCNIDPTTGAFASKKEIPLSGTINGSNFRRTSQKGNYILTARGLKNAPKVCFSAPKQKSYKCLSISSWNKNHSGEYTKSINTKGYGLGTYKAYFTDSTKNKSNTVYLNIVK